MHIVRALTGCHIFMIALLVCSCDQKQKAAAFSNEPPTFSSDLEFLQRIHPIVLTSANGLAQVALVTAFQGRVMTSTYDGASGPSLGWINRELIASEKLQEHINAFGGEDRFWLGPEGGQYSIFFKKGVEFTLENWFTPPAIDSEPFELVSSSSDRASFRKAMQLENYSGIRFDLEVQREVRLLTNSEIEAALGIRLSNETRAVAFQSENKITNTGTRAWRKETGLLSIWILGMFPPLPTTTVVIPLRTSMQAMEQMVNDDYFGKVPAERLAVKNGTIYFSGDGQYRSKIGVAPQYAKPIMGSYDASNGILTLVQYSKPEDAIDYVNSTWKIQDDPYGGDVVNSYNDGPVTPGAKPFGPFYELETSSPGAALLPGESLLHIHRTIHLQGAEQRLDEIARRTLGVNLYDIVNALPSR